MSELLTITLAAGKGTRMKSELPKVLHKVAGKSMVQHVVDTAENLNPKQNFVIVGYKGEKVKAETEGNLEFVEQKKQLGTGHAVQQVADQLKNFTGNVLVLYGDTPLLTESTLKELIAKHNDKEAAITVLTTKVDNPTGYGRIIRDDDKIVKIVEEDDTNQKEAKIKEINTGICIFDSQLLVESLAKLDNDNAQGEYYLTDVVKILAEQNKLVTGLMTDNQQETIGVNTRRHLAKANQILRDRICNYHLDNGVTIIDPTNTYIDAEVEIGQDSIIHPFSFIQGESLLEEKVVIGPQSKIVDSQIGSGTEIKNSWVIGSQIGADSSVGPYAYIRPGTKTGKNVKIGDFVEVKQSNIEQDSKVPHLSYIGDAKIGNDTNIGAGTITANYDGINKYQTIIGDNVFIGSDSTLIAPIEIGDNAITGAGAVVNKDVKKEQTVVGIPAKPLNKVDK